MDTLKGKVAVVTGAASGIGRALAERFVREGMAVVLADVESGPLHETAATLSDSGDVLAVRTDVSDRAAVDHLRDAALARYGQVNVVCNNAGVGGGGPVAELALQTWQWTLGVNLWGVIHGVSAFLPHLLSHGDGHVVNTASIAGLVSFPDMAPYNVSKYGVIALTETMHQELLASDSTVGVTALCPGFVNTRIIESERNRPETLLAPDLTADNPAAEAERLALREVALETFKTQLSPVVVADKVVTAILAQRLYCFTDEVFRPLLRDRATAVTAGENLPAFGTLFERLLS